MKRFYALLLAAFVAVATMNAQGSRGRIGNGRIGNGRIGGSPAYRQGYNDARRYDRSTRTYHFWGCYDMIRPYFSLRVGPSFSTVNSDDPYLNGSSLKTGVNAGFAAGFPVSPFVPLYFETGLYYTQKGGKGSSGNSKFTYGLDYLELPFVFKYKHHFTPQFSIEPYVGGYAALGVSGKIKNFDDRVAYSSFSSNSNNSFKRGDAGMKFGCGLSYDMLHLDLTYDLGLADICRDGFDSSHNRAFMVNFGLNF